MKDRDKVLLVAAGLVVVMLGAEFITVTNKSVTPKITTFSPNTDSADVNEPNHL